MDYLVVFYHLAFYIACRLKFSCSRAIMATAEQRWTDSALAIHDSHGFTRCLWWFNSTRFTFSRCPKETRLPIPNYISIEVNDSTHDSFRANANLSRFSSIQFIHELQRTMLQIHPLHNCLIFSPPKLSKSVAKQSFIWCCWHFWELHVHWSSMRWIKVNLLPVSLSSLYHRGDNIMRFLL